MKKHLLLFLLALFTATLPGMAQTASEEIDLTAKGFANSVDVTTVTQGNITLTFDKSNGQNSPKYYTSGTSVRMYANNTLKVATNNSKKITEIVFQYGGTTSATLTPDSGTLNNANWSGNASSVTFKASSSGQRYIQKITVTYESDGGGTTEPVDPDPEDPEEPAEGEFEDAIVTSNFTGISYTVSKDWTSPSSKAVYTAQASSNSGFQMRTSKATGITVKTAPAGMKVSSITIDVTTTNNGGGGVSVYAGDSPYSIPAINGKPSGTAIQSGIKGTGNKVTIDAPYFIIVPTNDTYCVVGKVTVNWVSTSSGGGDEPEPEKPVAPTAITFNPEAGNITTLQSISLSVDDDATQPVTISYSIDNKDYTNTYSEPFTLEAGEHTVYVKASNEGGDFEASAKYTVEKVDAYQITFDVINSDSSTEMTNDTFLGYIITGKEYVESADGISKAYKGVKGIKLGTGSADGAITINLSEAGKVNATKIVVNAAGYSDTKATTLKVNDKSQTLSGTTLTDYVYDITGNIESIALASTGSDKRAYVKGITVYYGEPERIDYEALKAYEEDGVEFVYGETAKLELGEKHPATINFAYEPEGVVEIAEDGTITALKADITEVTASWEADNTWNAGEVTFIVDVEKAEFKPQFESSYEITVHETFDIKNILGENRPAVIVAISAEDNVSVSDDLVVTGEKAGTDTVMLSWDEQGNWKAGDAEINFVINPIGVPTGLTASVSDATPVENGTEVTFTAKGAETFTITTYGIDGTPVVQTVSPEQAKVTVTKMRRRFDVVATNEGGDSQTLELFYNIGTAVSGEIYTRVNTAEELHAGDQLVIGFFHKSQNDTYKLVMVDDGTNSKTDAYFKGQDYKAELTEEQIVDKNLVLEADQLPEQTMILTLVAAVDGKYNLQYNDQFLRTSDNGSDFYLDATPTDFNIYVDDANYLLITWPNRDASKSDYCLEYNTAAGKRFAGYVINHTGGTAQIPVTIFRQKTIEPEVVKYEINLSYDESADVNAVRILAANDFDMETEDGANYTAKIGSLEGNLSMTVGADGENVTLAGDGNAEENAQYIVRGGDNGADYIFVGTNPDLAAGETMSENVSGIKLIGSDAEGALTLSTHPNVYNNVMRKHLEPTVTVALDPFRSITMGLSTDENKTTGVADIAVDAANGDAQYYNLQGVRLDGRNLTPGQVVIVRRGNTATKAVVR